MSHEVNPPPLLRIPGGFYEDPNTRAFFEEIKIILFQLWQRTGGSFDAVAGKQIVTVISSDSVLDNSAYGSLIVVDADTAPVQITLPPVAQDNEGETVDVAILDATYDTTVIPSAGTIFGDTSVLMNQQFMSIQYTVVASNTWIAS